MHINKCKEHIKILQDEITASILWLAVKKHIKGEKLEFKHKPVLLNECIEGLNIKPNGIYVDGTIRRSRTQ